MRESRSSKICNPKIMLLILLVKMGSDGVSRNEFQGARVWEKFKHRDKIYWGEGKQYVLGDIEGRQSLATTVSRYLIILHMFSWFSGTSKLSLK